MLILEGENPSNLPQTRGMTFTLRHRAQAILRTAGWILTPPPVIWSPRMARCAGLFVVEKGFVPARCPLSAWMI
jgi:hypothetical protein